MGDDLVERLRAQHNDLRQGAYYMPDEDPQWDATVEAADEIERLRGRVTVLDSDLIAKIERLEAELADMAEEARDGWGYADDYFQHKWLAPERLREWFPNNRYLDGSEAG